jgi:hypothetical protein
MPEKRGLNSPGRLHIGTFRKLLLIKSSRRLGVDLMGLLVKGGKKQRRRLKILLCEWIVKGKIASSRGPYFLAKIGDFHLKN